MGTAGCKAPNPSPWSSPLAKGRGEGSPLRVGCGYFSSQATPRTIYNFVTGQMSCRRILSDHTIIQRPDCAFPCNEQTAFCIMTTHLKLDDRLLTLRAEDRFRSWSSLDDERVCIICKRKFNGRQVEIRRAGNRKYQLHCPTEGCNSRPHLWIYPATPLVSHVVESDWWHAARKKQERRMPESMRRHTFNAYDRLHP